MALAVKRAHEMMYLNPCRKFCRVRHIQVSVGVKNILVHHDIGCKLATGGAITEARIIRQVPKRAVHNLGKAVQLRGSRNLVTAIYKIRFFRDNRLRGMRRHSKHGDCGKKEHFFS